MSEYIFPDDCQCVICNPDDYAPDEELERLKEEIRAEFREEIARIKDE